jgi:hypothetical protein
VDRWERARDVELYRPGPTLAVRRYLTQELHGARARREFRRPERSRGPIPHARHAEGTPENVQQIK